MKRIIVVLEALAHDYIMEVEPSNLMRLDVHPAVSFGLGSRPATAALMGGMLPVCQIPECYHRDIREKWSNQFFFTTIRKITERQFYLCPNGWSLEVLLPWMNREDAKLNFKWLYSHQSLPSREIVDYFLEGKQGYRSYFAYLHFFESHWPFYSPKGHDRREALLFLDQQVGRVLDACKEAEIIVCSDHNLPPRVVSAAADVPSPKTMLSFIASNFKDSEEWDVDSDSLAKEVWLR